MGLAKPLRMGTKATAGTHSREAHCQHFPTAFLPVRCCFSPLLLPISTRWSYSNMALVAAPGEQYTTTYFISMTIFLKWVGFYEKLSSKKNPQPSSIETAGARCAFCQAVSLKGSLQKLLPGDAGVCRAAFPTLGWLVQCASSFTPPGA